MSGIANLCLHDHPRDGQGVSKPYRAVASLRSDARLQAMSAAEGDVAFVTKTGGLGGETGARKQASGELSREINRFTSAVKRYILLSELDSSNLAEGGNVGGAAPQTRHHS